MTKKYKLPSFLSRTTTQNTYERWLKGRVVAHVRRDKRRGNRTATPVMYRDAIHKAVSQCGGRDFYTGEQLAWSLIGTYSNKKSKANRKGYKASFALLPTIDHVNDGLGPADFKICSWRTNDAKSDLSIDEFLKLCKRVITHNRRARRSIRSYTTSKDAIIERHRAELEAE